MTIAAEPRKSFPFLPDRQILAPEGVSAGGEPEVVADAGRLAGPVRRVHAAETPDVAAMLRGGGTVLTAGVLPADDESAQTEYTCSLRRADAAAVVLGLGRAFRAPPDVVRRARFVGEAPGAREAELVVRDLDMAAEPREVRDRRSEAYGPPTAP